MTCIYSGVFFATILGKSIFWLFHGRDDSRLCCRFCYWFSWASMAMRMYLRQSKPSLEICRCFKNISILLHSIPHDIMFVTYSCGGRVVLSSVGTQMSRFVALSLPSHSVVVSRLWSPGHGNQTLHGHITRWQRPVRLRARQA